MTRNFSTTSFPNVPEGESSSLTSTKVQLSAVPSDIIYVNIENPDATNKAYVQFFDALAADVTVGTTKPRRSIQIPAGATWDCAFQSLMGFDVAITIAATTTREGSTTAVTALIIGCIDRVDRLSA